MEGWLWMLADPGFGDLGFPSIEGGDGGSEGGYFIASWWESGGSQS